MNIEIKDSIIEEIGDLPEKLNSNLHDFLITAIRNQINISKVVLEEDLFETEEFHEYPILQHEAGRLMKALKNKGIEAKLIINPEDKKDIKIKAKVSSKDFGYVKSISRNHDLLILGPPEEMRTGNKMSQLHRMYNN